MSPRRSRVSASRSQAACWRRFSLSVTVGSRRASPLRSPPASIALSCFGSPTSTTFARAPRRRRGALRPAWCRPWRLRRRPPRCGRRARRVPSASWRARSARVSDGMPVCAWSCAAAVAASAAPTTWCPERVQASWAASRQNVLPVPAAATSTSMPFPEVVIWATTATCSGESSGRASSAARSVCSATAAPAGARSPVEARVTSRCSSATRLRGGALRIRARLGERDDRRSCERRVGEVLDGR